jgi:hypothetical protein
MHDDLDLPTSNTGLAAFGACWQAARQGGRLPELDAVVDRMCRQGLPIDNIALLGPSDGRILVLIAGPALAAHYGYDQTGADLLDLTPAGVRDIRSQRFRAVTSVPCGMYVRDGRDAALFPGGCVEVLHLPVVDGRGPDRLALSLHLGLDTVRRKGDTIALAEEIAWVDIGCGIPASTTNPLVFGLRRAPPEGRAGS